MRLRSRPLRDQVIVITGSSSGIGLCTARVAAARGARVILVARNEPALREITSGIEGSGGRAAYVTADVGCEEDVRRVGEFAVQRFGRIDTWVNNAMTSIFGRLTDIPTEEHRRLFETNYWGVVYGSRTAVEHLEERGGTLINIGSALSDRAIPIQGAYCASKFAVKGFTEALRMEVEQRELPIQVTLVKPSSIDTPYYRTHARNYLPRAPKNPPPVYDPRLVAETILQCAIRPKRDVFVGGGGWALSALNKLFPRLTDLAMERHLFSLQMTDDPPPPRERHNLFSPGEDGQERGNHPNHVFQDSLVTRMSLHPVAASAAIAGAALLAAALLGRGMHAKARRRLRVRTRTPDRTTNVVPLS